MSKYILSLFFTLLTLLALLAVPTAADGYVDPQTCLVSSLTELENALGNPSYTNIVIQATWVTNTSTGKRLTFDWSAAGGKPYTLHLTPANPDCRISIVDADPDAFIDPHANWTIPANITVKTTRKISILYGLDVFLEGTWDCASQTTFSYMQEYDPTTIAALYLNGTVKTTAGVAENPTFGNIGGKTVINGSVHFDTHGGEVFASHLYIQKSASFRQQGTLMAIESMTVEEGTPYLDLTLEANNIYQTIDSPVVFQGDISARSLRITGAGTIAADSTVTADWMYMGHPMEDPEYDICERYLQINGTLALKNGSSTEIYREVRLAENGVLILHPGVSFGQTDTEPGRVTGNGTIQMFAQMGSKPGDSVPFYYEEGGPLLFGERDTHPAKVAETVTILRNWSNGCTHPRWTGMVKVDAAGDESPHYITYCEACGTYYKYAFVTLGDTDVFIDGPVYLVPPEVGETLAATNGDVHIDMSNYLYGRETALPDSVMEAVSNSDTVTALTISTMDAAASFPKAVINAVSEALPENADLSIKLARASLNELNQNQQATLQNMSSTERQLLDLTMLITNGEAQTIVHELGGAATIRVPFSIYGENHIPKVAWLQEDGTMETIPCQYEEETVIFETDHFSHFLIFTIPEAPMVQFQPEPDSLSAGAYWNDSTADGILIVARYNQQKMTAVQVSPVTAQNCESGMYWLPVNMGGSGSEYRAFLLNKSYVPICEAENITYMPMP